MGFINHLRTGRPHIVCENMDYNIYNGDMVDNDYHPFMNPYFLKISHGGSPVVTIGFNTKLV
jgi:hypothetical protein